MCESEVEGEGVLADSDVPAWESTKQPSGSLRRRTTAVKRAKEAGKTGNKQGTA
jgi:hypothetical protein